MDLLRETWNRVTGYKYNYRTRLLPFWSLILPTSVYFLGTEVLAFAMEAFYQKLFVLFKKLFDENTVNNNLNDLFSYSD
jgi:hypothetical protein